MGWVLDSSRPGSGGCLTDDPTQEEIERCRKSDVFAECKWEMHLSRQSQAAGRKELLTASPAFAPDGWRTGNPHGFLPSAALPFGGSAFYGALPWHGRPRALTGSAREISLPVRFVRWFAFFTDFRVSIALCALEFLKFPHMFRRSPNSGAPASIHQLLHIIHIHVRFADIPAWLASTSGPLASFTRERRLWRRFHRAFERQAVP